MSKRTGQEIGFFCLATKALNQPCEMVLCIIILAKAEGGESSLWRTVVQMYKLVYQLRHEGGCVTGR